jgi:hypothetical protein
MAPCPIWSSTQPIRTEGNQLIPRNTEYASTSRLFVRFQHVVMKHFSETLFIVLPLSAMAEWGCPSLRRNLNLPGGRGVNELRIQTRHVDAHPSTTCRGQKAPRHNLGCPRKYNSSPPAYPSIGREECEKAKGKLNFGQEKSIIVTIWSCSQLALSVVQFSRGTTAVVALRQLTLLPATQPLEHQPTATTLHNNNNNNNTP